MTIRQQLAVSIVAAAFLGLLAMIALRHEPFPASADDVVSRMYAGALCIGAGVLVGRWRPTYATSWLLVVAGALFLTRLFSWSNDPRLFTFGGVMSGVGYAVFAHLALAMPEGHLMSSIDRALTVGGYGLALASGIVPNLFFECQTEFGFGCPGNLLLLRDDADALGRTEDVFAIVGSAYVALVLIRLAWRWHRASAVARRVVGPPFATVGVVLVLVAMDFFELWDRWGEVASLVHSLVVSLIPMAVLVGVLRSKARAGDIGDLVVSVEGAGRSIRAELQRLLAEALADPTVRLDTPALAAARAPGPGRLRTAIATNGRTLAVMECDMAVNAEPEVLAAALATATLALDNERLIDEVKAQLDEATRSRARLVAAQLVERRRLERDLHDGAQQRLVTTRLLLAMAREQGETDAAVIAEALDELGAAITDLRDLARGVHPATVTEHGLPIALETLAERAPIPVAVRGTAPRLTALSEITAYFVVAEALTNVVKHAEATHADVELSVDAAHLVVSVTDDGCGGADPGRGTGLVGLRDRVEAAGGRIEVHGAAGSGTCVRVELPCGDHADSFQPTADAP